MGEETTSLYGSSKWGGIKVPLHTCPANKPHLGDYMNAAIGDHGGDWFESGAEGGAAYYNLKAQYPCVVFFVPHPIGGIVCIDGIV